MLFAMLRQVFALWSRVAAQTRAFSQRLTPLAACMLIVFIVYNHYRYRQCARSIAFFVPHLCVRDATTFVDVCVPYLIDCVIWTVAGVLLVLCHSLETTGTRIVATVASYLAPLVAAVMVVGISTIPLMFAYASIAQGLA